MRSSFNCKTSVKISTRSITNSLQIQRPIRDLGAPFDSLVVGSLLSSHRLLPFSLPLTRTRTGPFPSPPQPTPPRHDSCGVKMAAHLRFSGTTGLYCRDSSLSLIGRHKGSTRWLRRPEPRASLDEAFYQAEALCEFCALSLKLCDLHLFCCFI